MQKEASDFLRNTIDCGPHHILSYHSACLRWPSSAPDSDDPKEKRSQGTQGPFSFQSFQLIRKLKAAGVGHMCAYQEVE